MENTNSEQSKSGYSVQTIKGGNPVTLKEVASEEEATREVALLKQEGREQVFFVNNDTYKRTGVL